MADNVTLNSGTGGATLAADDITSVWYQRVKISLGADGSATDALGGAGAVAAGVARVTLASDDPGVVALDNLDAQTADYDTGAGTDTQVMFGIALPASGGAVAGGTTTNPVVVNVNSMPASTNTLEVVGDVAHDAAAAGNPVLLCGISQDWDTTAPPNRVNAEADATRLATDRDGALFVRTGGPQYWDYHENSSSALTDATVEAAPGAGLSLYVTDIVCSTGAATAMNIFFEEVATTVLGPFYLEAVAGRGFHIRFATPKKITANTALTVTTSAAIAHSIDVTGFVAQG